MLIGSLSSCLPALAQSEDSLSAPAADTSSALKDTKQPQKEKVLTLDEDRKEKEHSPTRAGIYSAVVPGLGQVYNKKYWKIPIIYAAGGYLLYETLQLNSQYRTFTCAYEKALKDEDFTTCSDTYDWGQFQVSNDPTSTLRKQKDNFRRDRDMFILYTSLVYVLNMVDAVVDANLWEFDINDDLSLKSTPNMYFAHNNYIFGGQISLSFK